MKALVYTGVGQVEYRDAPDPVRAEGQSLISVEAVGICGSDMHGYHGADPRRVPPLILGHEAAGTVLEGPMQGQRVTVNPMTACGTCRYCIEGRDNICPDRKLISIPPAEGAFAERLAIAAKNCVPIPDHVPSEHAALTEPLACGWHAIRLGAERLTQPLSTARVVIIGGGAIGLGAALCAKDHGAKDIWIAEPSALRRTTAEAAGPFKTYDPTTPPQPLPASGEGLSRNSASSPLPVHGEGPGVGYPAESTADLVIDAYGSERSRADASKLAAPGGVIAHIGLAGGGAGLDTRKMTLWEIDFIGTYTYTMADFHATAQAIFDGRLGDFSWIEQRPLSDGAAAFADLDAGTVAAAKIVLRPDG